MVVIRDEPVTLLCEATGDPEPDIKWMKDGVEVRTAPTYPGSHRVILPNGALFFLKAVQSKKEDDQGTYWCVARNSEGESVSRKAQLDIARVDGTKNCKFYDRVVNEGSNIFPQSLATEYGPAVELTKRYGDLISWKTPFNINLTELYHRQNISAVVNTIADEFTQDIMEQKKLRRKRKNHAPPYKYTKIFSKSDYRASWILTIEQVSVQFFSIVDQFNIFFNGGNLTQSQINELQSIGTPEMEIIKNLSEFKNEIDNMVQELLPIMYNMLLNNLKEDFPLTKVTEEAECLLDLAVEKDLVSSDKKKEFLEAIEHYYNKLKDKEEMVNYIRQIHAVVENYFWKKMKTDMLAEKVYRIFHIIRRLLITLDVNGLVKIIDRINKTVDNGIWKVMNGEWPAMEKYFDVFLRTTIASEKVWNNLEVRRLQLQDVWEDKVVRNVQNAVNSMQQPSQQNTLVFILSDDEKFENQMEKLTLTLDKILENLAHLKEAFYSEGLHCDACNEVLNDHYLKISWWISHFNLRFLFENWNSANLEDYEEDETVPDFFETLLYSNAKNVILSLYGDCGEKFHYEFYVSEYMC